MPDGQTKTITFEGKPYIFPSDASDAEISTALTQHAPTQAASPAPTFAPGAMPQGSYQTRPGGPILNANETPFRTGVTQTEKGLGINNPQSLGDAITQALKSFGGFVGKSAAEPFQGTIPQSPTDIRNATAPLTLPVSAALAIPNVIARGTEGIAGSLESSIKDITQGWNRHDPRSIAAGVGEFIPAKAATVEGPERTTVQRYLNIGPELTERAVAARDAKVAEITADNKQTLLESKLDHQEKVRRVQEDYNKQVADIEQDNRAALVRARSGYEAKEADYHAKLQSVRASNAEARAAMEQKQQLMTEVQGHAQDLAGQLTQLAKDTKVQAKAMYPQIDGTVDSADVRNIVEDAITSNIRGTEKPPTMLGAMLKDLTPEDPLAQASVFRGAGSASRGIRGGTQFMDLPPSVRERIMPTLSPEERALAGPSSRGGFGESLDFDRLHGYITELGEELQRDLSGDERAAITQTRGSLVDMMRKMADDDGKLGQFTAAQKNWAQYENTFNKTWSDRRGLPSPIAKALAAKDPVTGQVIPERAASILLRDLNYKQAQQMLGRYGGKGSDVLQLLKEKADHITTLPKVLKETPEPSGPTSAAISGLKEVPHEPLGPTMAAIGRLKELPPQVDPRALKVNALRETAQGLRSMKGIRAALDIASLIHFMYSGNPASLAYPVLRRGLSYGLETGTARDFLTKPSAAEMNMISPRRVYPSKAAAMKAAKEPTVSSAERRNLQTRAINEAMMDQLYGELRKAVTPEDRARVQRNIDDLKEQQ